ncbi:formylglycine-generating enzyme family protein [Puniceibacterium sediminis]|uniref:Sulfatase-modifying factor enzyme 1 n=1 Tax=Puniceibacterium sediminis TaxID=1608407 RepID=A0A238YPF3_9RHOB|nr:SUMF1/EgtB/PvdO family nonheme iron enzyme [Puniceibacterium sediminis]SNR73025.1 Sulfatase-modifying factor enzyme 1 [Puniceibacterium sediminis]
MKRHGLFRIATVVAASAVVAGALVTGAAWMTRGPDLTHLPDMVGPITMDNGRQAWVQKYEVTVAEWNACHAAGGCALWLVVRSDQNAADTPATGLSYPDALEYVRWLNTTTGQSFRLPGVAEWQVVAHSVLPEEPDPIFTDPALRWASAYLIKADIPRALKAKGSFSTTKDGIADLDGSVWEWTADCFSDTPPPV